MKKSWSKLAAIFTLVGAFHTQGGTISYQAIPATQSDANCGITEENNEYTTAVDGGNTRGTARVINGISLDALSGNGQTISADNCTLNALSGSLANGSVTKGIRADGIFKEVLSDMTVNNGAGDNSQQEIALDPSSLEEGTTYDLRIYICPSSGQNRQVNLAFVGDEQETAETGFFNEDDATTSVGKFSDRNQVYYINYRYTWDGDTTPGITIIQKSGSAPFCLYALTNQVVPAGATTTGDGGTNPSFAVVDMNRIFKEYGKTKDAEAKINEAKNDAKKKYDERSDNYKKALAEINEMNRLIDLTTNEATKAEMTRNRDNKITAIKQMEREINEWRAAREKELQDQALKLRSEIVAEITATIKKLDGDSVNVILDVSGMSLNGVPLIILSPPSANMSDRVIAALNGGKSSSFSQIQDVKIAGVNMNEVFKQFNKTKASEAKINANKETAKKEYDEKADRYKKALDDINDLNKRLDNPNIAADSKAQMTRDRDNKITAIKEMEREINEFRKAREKELQDQATKMRTELVAEINKEIEARVAKIDMGIVLDISGQSLNGVPAILCRELPDLSDQVVTALNQTGSKSRKKVSAETSLASSADMRFGCVDMNRAFKAMPETKQAEIEINKLKEKAKAELATADAKARETKEKELQDITVKKREPIVQKVTAGVLQVAEAAGFNVVFDMSGNSLSGVPFVMSKGDLPDLTDQLISQLTSSR
jgi:outer membrane protein